MLEDKKENKESVEVPLYHSLKSHSKYKELKVTIDDDHDECDSYQNPHYEITLTGEHIQKHRSNLINTPDDSDGDFEVNSSTTHFLWITFKKCCETICPTILILVISVSLIVLIFVQRHNANS